VDLVGVGLPPVDDATGIGAGPGERDTGPSDREVEE